MFYKKYVFCFVEGFALVGQAVIKTVYKNLEGNQSVCFSNQLQNILFCKTKSGYDSEFPKSYVKHFTFSFNGHLTAKPK